MKKKPGFLSLTTSQTERRLAKRVPVTPPDTGFTSVDDGWETLIYKVFVDWPALHALARKAASNRNGKSQLGPFVISIEERKRHG